MGNCWCKDVFFDTEPYNQSRDPYNNGNEASTSGSSATSPTPESINKLVLDLLRTFYTVPCNNRDCPVSLLRLHKMAEKDEGWILVMKSAIHSIPESDPSGAATITIIFDDCPLPSKNTIIRFTEELELNKAPTERNQTVRVERNICIILGCIAEKLAGANSVAILNDSTLTYLLAMIDCDKSCVVLFAMIAIEKFAMTTENKMKIKRKFADTGTNPIIRLEDYCNSVDCGWRQVGFCAQWMLDNTFVTDTRILSYKVVDMSRINVILNLQDVSEYLKISPDGLEARSDSYLFESVRSTFQIDSGAWFYECTVITPGVMQIGWATKGSEFRTYEGFGIGDDTFSMSYDGYRRIVWYNANCTSQLNMPSWEPGDTVGCLIDVDRKEVLFYLNGRKLPTYKQIFNVTRTGYFAAASFMAFQQCRFNFGHEPFLYPPQNRQYSRFNDFGQLEPEQKLVLPRRMVMEKLAGDGGNEFSCTLCFAEPASCTLLPCGHKGFCVVCITRLKQCPMCRRLISNVAETHV